MLSTVSIRTQIKFGSSMNLDCYQVTNGTPAVQLIKQSHSGMSSNFCDAGLVFEGTGASSLRVCSQLGNVIEPDRLSFHIQQSERRPFFVALKSDYSSIMCS